MNLKGKISPYLSKPNTPTIIRYELFSNGDTNHVQEEAENEAGPHELVGTDKCIRNVCVVFAIFYMNRVMMSDQVEEEDEYHRENPSAKHPPKTSS